MNRPARHGRNDSSAGRRALQAERTGTLPGVRAFRAGGRKGAFLQKSPLPSPPHPPSIPQKTLSGRMAGRGFPPGRTLTDGPPVRRRLLFLWRGWRLLSGGGKGLFAKKPLPPALPIHPAKNFVREDEGEGVPARAHPDRWSPGEAESSFLVARMAAHLFVMPPGDCRTRDALGGAASCHRSRQEFLKGKGGAGERGDFLQKVPPFPRKKTSSPACYPPLGMR